MSAETVYTRINEAIAAECEADENLSMFELIGVVRMIEAELVEAAMAPDDDDDDTDPDANYDS